MPIIEIDFTSNDCSRVLDQVDDAITTINRKIMAETLSPDFALFTELRSVLLKSKELLLKGDITAALYQCYRFTEREYSLRFVSRYGESILNDRHKVEPSKPDLENLVMGSWRDNEELYKSLK